MTIQLTSEFYHGTITADVHYKTSDFIVRAIITALPRCPCLRRTPSQSDRSLLEPILQRNDNAGYFISRKNICAFCLCIATCVRNIKLQVTLRT